MYEVGAKICQQLQAAENISVTLVNARFVKPLDTELLDLLSADHELIITIEENVRSGGYGEHVSSYMEEHHPGCRVLSAAIPDQFIPQGEVKSLRSQIGLDAACVLKKIEEYLKDKKEE